MVYKFTGLPWVLIHMHPSPQHQLWSDPFVVRVMEEEIWIQKTWVIYSRHPLSRLGELPTSDTVLSGGASIEMD